MQSRKKKYACPFPGCAFSFNRPYRLAQHRLRHVDVRPFACKEENCSKAYTSKSHLDRHINSVHKETELDVLYCCPKCIKHYSNRQNLNRHMKKHHGEDKESYICDYCSALFIKKHHMKAHMFKHTGVKAFRCPYCIKDYASLADKKKHIRNHKVYSCDQCYSKFYRWTDMLSHTRSDHMSPEFICNDCGKEFKERPLFLRHVKRHMPSAQTNIYLCPYENCQRCYTRSNNLKQHVMVKHQGKRFGCELCGAQLSTKAKLNEHIERHSRPKVILRVAKTIENGRKRRKDMNTVRVSTAKKLAGLNVVDEQELGLTHEQNNFTDNNNLYHDEGYKQI